MLRENDPAPDFALPDHTNTTITLSDQLKAGPVVVYFYPADFTPGCTAQACSIRDLHTELAHAGITVLGISPQSPKSHARFKKAHNLPYTLLADTDKTAIKAFGVAGPLGLITRRVTFLITPHPTNPHDHPAGIISKRLIADLNIAKHADLLKHLASNHANPANAPA